MLKIFSPSDWDFGDVNADIVRMARGGKLTGDDQLQLIKRSSEEFVDLAKKIKIAEDEVPIHIIAMGSSERYGGNRNGDGFKRAALQKYHETFVKDSKWYRDHKNKDKTKSYGIVKMSHYNQGMDRVELLVALNATKSAAERNGGLEAERELEKLAKKEDLATSMSCRVDYDTCSSCGNNAKTRKDYCNEDSCVGPRGEKRGGCSRNLAKVSEDGHVLHVDNPHPHFFDISHVFRPADRIAYGNVADYLEKSSCERVFGGAELAEILNVSEPLHIKLASACDPVSEKFVKTAYSLAAIEDELDSYPVEFCRAFSSPIDGNIKFAVDRESLRALSDQKILLPLENFAASTGHTGVNLQKVSEQLPAIFNRLISGDVLTNTAQQISRFIPLPGLVSEYKQAWAEKFAADLSLDERHVRRRVWRSAITDLQMPRFKKAHNKSASLATAQEIKCAIDYALYQLAFVSSVDADIPGLTTQLCVIHNHS